MPWIGEVFVPYIISEEFTQSRDVSESNYNSGNPSVYEFDRALENGDLPVVLHQPEHINSESLSEQVDAVKSLVFSKAPENAFSFLSEQGHLSVESVGSPREARDNMREATLAIRYMPDSLYQPAIKTNPAVYDNDYSVTANGVVAISAAVDSVYERNKDTGDLSSVSSFGTLTTENGDVNLYPASDKQYMLEYPDSNYTKPVRVGSLRAFEHNGSSTESDWTRIYADSYAPDNGLVVDNRYIRIVFNDPTDSNTHLYWYDGSAWVDAGTIDIGTGFLKATRHGNISQYIISTEDGLVTLKKGNPFARLVVEETTSVTWDTGNGDYPADSSTVDSTDVHVHGSNANISYNYMLSKPSSDGTKDDTGSTFAATGLDSRSTYNIMLGVVPDSWVIADTAHRSVTAHNQTNELLQRRVL